MSLATPAAPVSTGTSRPPAPAVSTAERLQRLDRSLLRGLGADLRLLYGLAVPVLVVVAAMIPMFLDASYAMDGAVMVIELACLALVIRQILAVLDEEPSAE